MTIDRAIMEDLKSVLDDGTASKLPMGFRPVIDVASTGPN
jgi:hypothetical protein